MLVFEFIYKSSHTHITKWTEPGMIRFMWVDAFFLMSHQRLALFSHMFFYIRRTDWASLNRSHRAHDVTEYFHCCWWLWAMFWWWGGSKYGCERLRGLYSCAACLMSIEIDHFNQHKCNTFFFFSIEFEVKVKLSNAIRNITTRKNTNTQTQTNMLCAGETTKC